MFIKVTHIQCKVHRFTALSSKTPHTTCGTPFICQRIGPESYWETLGNLTSLEKKNILQQHSLYSHFYTWLQNHTTL